MVITRVNDDDEERLAYLADIGITPGTTVHVTDVAPFGMVTLDIDDTEKSVPEEVASVIHVTTKSGADDPASTEQRGDI